ncbi:TerD family protein, partial [Streptomyces sp. NPDC059466]
GRPGRRGRRSRVPGRPPGEAGYRFPQAVGTLPDPDFRLPPQGPQFVGR